MSDYGKCMICGVVKSLCTGHTPAQLSDYARNFCYSSEKDARIADLERICAETYQVVGILARSIESDHVNKALDNLSQQKLVHEDVLPFPAVIDRRIAEREAEVSAIAKDRDSWREQARANKIAEIRACEQRDACGAVRTAHGSLNDVLLLRPKPRRRILLEETDEVRCAKRGEWGQSDEMPAPLCFIHGGGLSSVRIWTARELAPGEEVR